MTDTGLVRGNNEDNWVVDPALSVAIVADGMGGAACGEIASALTIATVCAYLREPPEDLPAEQRIKEAVREANRRVIERAQAEPSCDGMGSTIVAAVWNLPELVIANVGDSRAYLWRVGKLLQLSYDQTLANELKRTLGLTEEQVSSYTNKNVLTMAIGASENILVHTETVRLSVGDQLLLCSDGLHGLVNNDTISSTLARGVSLREAVAELIERAKDAGGEDNITAILLRYSE